MALIKDIEKDFKALVKNGKLGHSYLFYGTNLSEQFIFAKELANFLETGKWEQGSRTLTDAYFVDGRVDDMGIGTARKFAGFLYQKPSHSKYKVLVVNEAQKLTTQAQNAILKISEEPPEYSLIILTVQDPGVLVDPLVSRFLKVYFSPNGQEESEDDKEAKKIVKQFISGGVKEKKEIIKLVVKEGRIVDNFVKSLIQELNKDPIKNNEALAELLHRYLAMNQYNVNKRLQLESVLKHLS